MLDGGPETRRVDFRFIRPPAREYVYSAYVLHADASMIVLQQTVVPSKPLVVVGEEVLAPGYRAVWFLFQGAPYDVARIYRPNGDWTGYYVDVLEPVSWTDSDPDTLDPIVDLFLDLWVSPEGTFSVLDKDEFEEAVRNNALSGTQAQHAKETLEACITELTLGRFPPDPVKNFE